MARLHTAGKPDSNYLQQRVATCITQDSGTVAACVSVASIIAVPLHTQLQFLTNLQQRNVIYCLL